jgi:hypothetical protein
VAGVWSEARHGGGSGMAEATVPEIWVLLEDEGGVVESLAHGVQRTRTIASKNHGPGEKILHRKTIRIKLNGTIIIDSELPNGNKIFDNIRNDKNIIEIQRFGGRVDGFATSVCDRNRRTVSDGNKLRVGGF